MGDLRASELRERVGQLGRLLDFPPDTYKGHEREAAWIMAHLAMMPRVRRDRQRTYGNELLVRADNLIPSGDPMNTGFWDRLRSTVITMQELPAWYLHFSKSNDALIKDYWWLNLELDVMATFGMGGLASPKGGTVRNALQSAHKGYASGAQSAARGLVTGGAKGLRGAATGGFSGEAAAGWALGSLVYVGGLNNREAIKRELIRRYQEKRLSEEEYRRVLGDTEPLPRQYLYRLR